MKQFLFFIFLILNFQVGWAMDFKPPGKAERLKAIGSTRGLSESMRLALDPTDFEPIPAPHPGDWLAVHPEPGQTFDDFVGSRPNRPDGKRSKIYLQPLGDFPGDRSPSLEILRQYAAAYFAMEVQVLPSLPLREPKLTTRINPLSRNRQVLSTDILNLLKTRLPKDAFCFLAVTMEDLYPSLPGTLYSARLLFASGSAYSALPVTIPPSTEESGQRDLKKSCCGEAARCWPTKPPICSPWLTASISAAF